MPESVLDDLERCGPYRLPASRLDEVKTAAANRQWKMLEFAPATAGDRTDWLGELGHQLALPAHFGANFDALYDCLGDREIMPHAALLLIFPDVKALGEAGSDTLIAVLQAVADDWREQGRRLWALFTAPGIDLDPLPKK